MELIPTEEEREVCRAVNSLPLKRQQVFKEVLEECPTLLNTESPPHLFLRASSGRVPEAAARLADFWEMRRRLFLSRSLMPLTSPSSVVLSKDDLDVYQTGFFVRLPNDQHGRTVLFYNRDRLRNFDDEESIVSSMLSCAFYIISISFQREPDSNSLVLFNMFSESTKTSPIDQLFWTGLKEIISCSPCSLDNFDLIFNYSRQACDENLQSNFAKFSDIARNLFGAQLVTMTIPDKNSQLLELLKKKSLLTNGIPKEIGGGYASSSSEYCTPNTARSSQKWRHCDEKLGGMKNRDIEPAVSVDPTNSTFDSAKMTQKNQVVTGSGIEKAVSDDPTNSTREIQQVQKKKRKREKDPAFARHRDQRRHKQQVVLQLTVERLREEQFHLQQSQNKLANLIRLCECLVQGAGLDPATTELFVVETMRPFNNIWNGPRTTEAICVGPVDSKIPAKDSVESSLTRLLQGLPSRPTGKMMSRSGEGTEKHAMLHCEALSESNESLSESSFQSFQLQDAAATAVSSLSKSSASSQPTSSSESSSNPTSSSDTTSQPPSSSESSSSSSRPSSSESSPPVFSSSASSSSNGYDSTGTDEEDEKRLCKA